MLSSIIALIYFLLPPIWHTNFQEAQKLAQTEQKLILLNFSGSDWCGPCMLLKKEYFNSEVFAAMANEKLILVNADFPRRKNNQLSAEQVAQNEKLADQYNPQGHFPLTLLLDTNGKVLQSWQGKPNSDVDNWTIEVEKACLSHFQK
jgi:thioredoxin-related protein